MRVVPQFFTSLGSIHSSGVTTWFKHGPSNNISVIHNCKQGKMLIIDFEYNKTTYRLINIYAPNKEEERKTLFASLNSYCTDNTIIIGDFNVALTQEDVGINNVFKGDCSRACLTKFMNNSNLIDIWRIFNPTKKEFSRRQVVQGVIKQSRIDLCLTTSNITKCINTVNYLLNSWSDHAMINVQLGCREAARGGGSWCLNASLLEDPIYHERFKKLLDKLTEEFYFSENQIQWWDKIKEKIKKVCIRYSKEKRQAEREEETSLRELLAREASLLESAPSLDTPIYENIKLQIMEIEKKKCVGAAIRSRADYIVDGEKCTAFFLGLEKRKQSNSYLTEIINERGEIVSDPTKVLEETHKFFSQLFNSEGVNGKKMNSVLDKISVKINSEDKEWCKTPITLAEVETAIKGLNKKQKSRNRRAHDRVLPGLLWSTGPPASPSLSRHHG